MAKELKTIICEGIRARYAGLDGCVLIDFRGLDAESTESLRATLREQGVEMNVLRNRLAKRVFEESGVPRDFIDLIEGPTAVLFGGDGAFTATKRLASWRKKNPDLAPTRGGLLDGRTLNPSEVEQLADIPEPEVLRSQVCGMFLAPVAHVASCARNPTGHFAGCVKAHHEEQSGAEGE